MQYSLNYSGTRFCPLKIKVTQFLDGFRLKSFHQPCSDFQETYFDFLTHWIFAKLSKTAYREIKLHDTYWICS